VPEIRELNATFVRPILRYRVLKSQIAPYQMLDVI
jgi:hypothetical protein